RTDDELHEALLLLGVMTDEEVQRAQASCNSSSTTTNTAPPNHEPMEALIESNRARRLVLGSATGNDAQYWLAAERWPMLQCIHPTSRIEPSLTLPESITRQQWERSEAIRELVRGRMEFSGPVTV